MRTSVRQPRTSPTVFLALALLLLPSASLRAADIRTQARTLEKQGRWFEACCLYDEILSKDRNHPSTRDAYRRCLRNFRQQRRLDDPFLQSLISKLAASEAADLYEEMFGTVLNNYGGQDRAQAANLFREGLRELLAVLGNRSSLQKHLPRVAQADIDAFRSIVEQWAREKVEGPTHAKLLIRKIISSGATVGIPPGLIALECACGACNSLDEYSLYLAPGRLSPAQAAVKHKVVGIGLELTLTGRRLEVARVYRKSPAAFAGLRRGDRITRIDGHAIDPAAPDIAAERLFGETGSTVELDVIPRGHKNPQTIKVARQSVMPSSIDAEIRGEMTGDYVGVITIHNFQETTFQEVKDAMIAWQGKPLRGIILDLRGNPGGMLKPSLGVAELFLGDSVLLLTQSPIEGLSRTYRSSNPTPYITPLVVLVDGETASAAEVLAGALKDNQRAILVGQPTFGKGSVQCVIPLERGPGGLRLTVARFTTPSRIPFSGRGIIPDRIINDADLDAAMKEADRILHDSGMGMMRMITG